MTTVDVQPLLQIHVVGTPRPKGSMRHVGNGRLVEQLAGSPDWRTTVIAAAYHAIACCHDPECPTLRAGYPYPGGVQVAIVLLFAAPKSAKPGALPSTVRTGDIDKHERNILDALQDAGVLRNDAQVVDIRTSKRYTTGAAGAHITVWPAERVRGPGEATDGVQRPAPVQQEMVPHA